MSMEDRTSSEEFSLEYTDERDREVDILAPSRGMSIAEKLARIKQMDEAAKPRGRRRVTHLEEVVGDVTVPFQGLEHRRRVRRIQDTQDMLSDFADTFRGDEEGKRLVEEIAKRRSA